MNPILKIEGKHFRITLCVCGCACICSHFKDLLHLIIRDVEQIFFIILTIIFFLWLCINNPLGTHVWNLILSNFLFLFFASLHFLVGTHWFTTIADYILVICWAVATSGQELRNSHIGSRLAFFFLIKLILISTNREISKKAICKNM